MTKLTLLMAFSIHCPIVVCKNTKLYFPKPSKILWHEAGKTAPPFEFPIYELHSDGETTVEMSDIKLYFHHNTKLPEYIGQTKVKDWKAEWVLTETNAEIKRVLLCNIPATKLEKELLPNKVDTWRKYTLLEFNIPDAPTMKFLKMKCPSTGDSYMLRVPPDMDRAENAIVWVNHGIHPDSFLRET